MPHNHNRRSLLVILSVFLFVTISTIIVSAVARGYQINLRRHGLPTLQATGLLSVISKPKGASVYLNDHLVTATDDTLNLPPDTYRLKIVKDGFLPWQKDILIQKELVTQVESQLFRLAPDLQPITSSGVIHPAISPDLTKIIFAVASASASKDNGLYLAELNSPLIPLTRNLPKQIATNSQTIDWSKCTFVFSPNSSQVLATFPSGLHLVLNLNQPITTTQLYDVTPTLSIIAREWQQQEQAIITAQLTKIPTELVQFIATDSAKNISYSSDNGKVLYLATTSVSLPDQFITPPINRNHQPQDRSLQPGFYYVYDLKEDTNYLLGSVIDLQNPFWLANSNNLVFTRDNTIQTIEYDGTNTQTIFAGQFDATIISPWSDGAKIATFISPYTGAPKNLYSITIR